MYKHHCSAHHTETNHLPSYISSATLLDVFYVYLVFVHLQKFSVQDPMPSLRSPQFNLSTDRSCGLVYWITFQHFKPPFGVWSQGILYKVRAIYTIFLLIETV